MAANFALLLIDIQKDFCPGGALAVPEGDKIIDPINMLIEKCRTKNILVVATRDWHPAGHCSFAENGGLWPVHCVRETSGAEFHPDLKIDPSKDIFINKDDARDVYSGFERTDLLQRLKENSIQTLLVGGLATDYCVKATILDGLKEGFSVFVIADGIQGVEVHPGDCERAIADMIRAGAVLIPSSEIGISFFETI